jgi:photosystem II stability/assembly factor-like uncharacterized protein
MLPRHFIISTCWLLFGCFFLGIVDVPTAYGHPPAYPEHDSPYRFPITDVEDAVWLVMPSGTTAILSDVWCSDDACYAVGSQGTILHFDGIQWRPMTSGVTEDFQGVWGTSTNNVYAVGGGGTVLHFNGDRWAPVNTPTIEFLRGAWGTTPDNVYITGTRGTIIHYDGVRWESMESNTPNRLYDIWGAANNDIFVAGHLATILHYDGTLWSPMASGVRPTLWGVWGTSGDNVFVVGGSGVIAHYEGTAWQIQDSGTTEDLLRVWGNAPNNAHAVGSGGTILKYDGQTWASMASPTPRTLKSVCGNSTGDVFAVGDAGIILYLTPSVPVFVELFEAVTIGTEVGLEWRVRTTDPVDAFVIRRIEINTGDHDSFRFSADKESARDTSVEPGEAYRYALTTKLTSGSQVTSQWVTVTIPPVATELASVYPNPFNPSITIRYRVGSPSPVNISIYDVRGVLIRRLVDQPSHRSGGFETSWDGSDHDGMRTASGVYFCNLESNGRVKTRRIVLVK